MGKRRHAGAAPPPAPHPPAPAGAAGTREAPAGYWLVLDTNVLIDYARHADGDAPDRPLPGEFIRFIGDNPGLVLRVNTAKREMRAFMRHYDANDCVRVQRLLGRFPTAKRRHLRGYEKYLGEIVAHLASVAGDPDSGSARAWLASKRAALASRGLGGAADGGADPAQRGAALGWLFDSARKSDVWIMAKAAKLSEDRPVRLVSNDGDMIVFGGMLGRLTSGRLLVARPDTWG